MSGRTAVLAAIAVLLAVLFIRLGLWQLDRREERRARNAHVASRLDSAAVPVSALPRDPELARYRRVTIEGTLDYQHELVHTGRTRDGAPGVHLLTPVRSPGTDTAVLVNRGWVYAPDATTVDASLWRESDEALITGWVARFPDADAGSAVIAGTPRAVRRLDRDSLAASLPYPLAPYYVVATAVSPERPPGSAPARLPLPELDEGPHLMYAVQWFAFAAIAVIGITALVRAERKSGRREARVVR